MNAANITAATLARIAAAAPMSREHGEAIAQAMIEALQPQNQNAAKIEALEFNIESISRELKNGFFASAEDKARKISIMRGMMLDHARLMYA